MPIRLKKLKLCCRGILKKWLLPNKASTSRINRFRYLWSFVLIVVIIQNINSILSWLWAKVFSALSWVWMVISWPFRFTWHSFESVIIGSTQLIGITHNPAWWETVILIIVPLYLLGSLLAEDEKKAPDENYKSKNDTSDLKATILVLLILITIACGIWVNPVTSTTNVQTPVNNKLTSTEEKTAVKIEEV